ncbi:MAG: MATE family efflux transporter [Clostridia bacterium]|nr:MATE family efflux transporter [Clostridia bacterium]
MTLTQKLRYNLIGDRIFYKKVILILIPIIIQNAVTHIVNLVDNIMVGSVGTLEMSAVAIVNQLLFVFNLCIFGGLSGAGIFTSQFAGAKDTEGVRHSFRMKIYIALCVCAVAIAVFLLIPKTLIGMYISENTSVSDATKTLGFGLDYLYIIIIGLIPFAVSQIYGSTLRELGETKLPMIASVAAIGINIIFNYVLIFGNEGLAFLPFAPMGVVGAAIATSLSRYVEMLIIIISVHKNSEKYDFIKNVYKSFKIPLDLCHEILKKGVPLLFNEFLWSFGMAFLMQCYSVRGIEVVASTNIASTVGNMFNVVYFSIGAAISIMCGQHMGAGELEKAKTTVWRLLFLSIISCLVVGSILLSLSSVIPMVYNTTDTVRHLATELLCVLALLMPFNAFCHGCYFAMRSGGKTIITMIFDSGFIWLISCPIAYIIAHYTNLNIVPFYLAVQGIEAVKAIIAGILIKKGFWINNMVAKKD